MHRFYRSGYDSQLAANKQTVYDFWRYALIGRNMEMAQQFLHEDYIQHNPNIPTGRAPFVAFFGSMPQNPVPDDIPGDSILHDCRVGDY